MEMIIDFPGQARVDAHFGSFTIHTDQLPAATAPTPFDTFLASIGTCAGIYVLRFCQQRDLPTEGIRIVERVFTDPSSGMVSKLDLEIQVEVGKGLAAPLPETCARRRVALNGLPPPTRRAIHIVWDHGVQTD